MDAFALPMKGTETRVNAQAYEYISQYLDSQKQVGWVKDVPGWYHSHPGYGCWLSNIGVETQRSNQQKHGKYRLTHFSHFEMRYFASISV